MDDEEKAKSKPFDAYDVQRIRLDKLFSNIVSMNCNLLPTHLLRIVFLHLLTIQHKPIEIPEAQKQRKIPEAPDFVRNVMGKLRR